MSVLSRLFRKNIYREIPVTSSFSRQKVLADFQVLSGNSNSLRRTELRSCTDANTNHLLSAAKASSVKQKRSWELKVGKPQLRHRRTHLLFKHLNALSQAAWSKVGWPGTGQDTARITPSLFPSPWMKACSWSAINTMQSLRSQAPSGHSDHAPSLHLWKKRTSFGEQWKAAR